jgi:hypothetical protein
MWAMRTIVAGVAGTDTTSEQMKVCRFNCPPLSKWLFGILDTLGKSGSTARDSLKWNRISS